MEEAIKIVKEVLAQVSGNEDRAWGARYVLNDIIARLEAAQQQRAPDVADGCPFCGVSAEDIADYVRLVQQEPPTSG